MSERSTSELRPAPYYSMSHATAPSVLTEKKIFSQKYECLRCSNFCSYLEKVLKVDNVNWRVCVCVCVCVWNSLHRGSIKTSYVM